MSSEHKRLTVHHRGFAINISYWIKHNDDKKIVSYSVKDGSSEIQSTQFVRESIGGKSGILGFGARPERSFHEMIAEAVEKSARVINEKERQAQPPDPEEIVETLEIRGYESTPR